MRRFCIVAVSVSSLLVAGAPAQADVAAKGHRQKWSGGTVRLHLRVHQAPPSITLKDGYPYGRT